MEQLTVALTKNSVKHLCRCASTLSTPALSNVLKSYYLTKCRTLTLSGTVALPQRFFKRTIRCPKCCVQYKDGSASYQIQPGHKKNRFVHRLLKRNVNGKSLTRFQEIYLKNLLCKGDADSHNTLVITCGVCKTETKEKLKKAEEKLLIETTPDTPRSRKKKKKDKFSGLNKDAVLSATPQHKPCKTVLQATPVTKTRNMRKDVNHKKSLFFQKQEKNKEIEKMNKKRKEVREKHKTLKGLNNLLKSSKQKQSPSASLKQFLTSI